jgi:hypothetical protein
VNAQDRGFWTAAAHAEKGAQQWRAAAVVQRSAEPDHAEFYALAGELVDTLRAIEALGGVPARQVDGYGAGRRLYDDEGGDPRARLRTAGSHLAELRRLAAAAERAANDFWSAISHIAVELE